MRGSSMLAVALACVFLLVAAVGSVHADSLAICRFQGSDTITGWITLTQYVEGGVVTIGSNFTSSVAVSALYAHVHTYGDLDGERECFVDYTYGPWSSAEADTHFTNSLTVHGFSLSGDNSIVGRSISLYESISNCAAGCNSVAVASCVVGKRNYAVSETTDPNTAALVLSEEPVSAYVKFVAGSSAPALAGEAWFVPTASGLVYVKVSVSGLTAGSVHAVHVHTYGDIHLATGISAGLHLNPAGVNHGYPPSVHRHMGDLGNFTASDDGVVEIAQLFDLLSFTAASGNIMGRGLIIHTLGDDGNPLNTNTSTGAAGGRLGMGVVAVSARLPDGFVDPTSVGDDMYTTYTASDFVSRVAVPAVPVVSAAATETRGAALHRVAKAVKALLSASTERAAIPSVVAVDVSAQRLLAAKALLADRAQEAADVVIASATAQCSAVCQLRRATQAAKMLLANAKPAKSSANVQVNPKQRSSANVEGVVPPQGSTTRPGTTSGTTSSTPVTAPPKSIGKLAVDGVKPPKSSANVQVKPKQRMQVKGVTVPPQGSTTRPGTTSSGTSSTPVTAPPKSIGRVALEVEVEAKPAKSSANVHVESPVRKLRRAKVAKATAAAGAAAL